MTYALLAACLAAFAYMDLRAGRAMARVVRVRSRINRNPTND